MSKISKEDTGRYTCMAASAVVFKTFSIMKLSVTTGGRILPIYLLLTYSLTCMFWSFHLGL